MIYLGHFGLREAPFGITPDTSFLYSCHSTQEALNTLVVAVANGEGFIKVTGEVGTGQTLLCRTLLATLGGVGVLLLAFVFTDARFRRNQVQVIGALVLGLLVVAGWYLTGHLGYGENPETLEMAYFATNTRTLESMSFVAPTAYSLELFVLWTDKSLRISFGIASVAGVVLGSFAYAVVSRQFRWEGFASLQDLRTQLTGAVLMGFGGVTAMGCTVGQGMSGLSTLALGSFLAVASIVAGAVATMQWQQR